MPANVDRTLIACLCMASVFLPMIQYLMQARNGGRPACQETSIQWLALPMEMDFLWKPDSIWKSLESSGMDHSLVILDEGSDCLPDRITQLDDNEPRLRFELFGVVREGEAPVYCFLDTEKVRWFRLQVGDCDASSKAELFMDEMDGQLYLRDQTNGRQFKVEHDNWAIAPVDLEENERRGLLP